MSGSIPELLGRVVPVMINTPTGPLVLCNHGAKTVLTPKGQRTIIVARLVEAPERTLPPMAYTVELQNEDGTVLQQLRLLEAETIESSRIAVSGRYTGLSRFFDGFMATSFLLPGWSGVFSREDPSRLRYLNRESNGPPLRPIELCVEHTHIHINERTLRLDETDSWRMGGNFHVPPLVLFEDVAIGFSEDDPMNVRVGVPEGTRLVFEVRTIPAGDLLETSQFVIKTQEGAHWTMYGEAFVEHPQQLVRTVQAPANADEGAALARASLSMRDSVDDQRSH